MKQIVSQLLLSLNPQSHKIDMIHLQQEKWLKIRELKLFWDYNLL